MSITTISIKTVNAVDYLSLAKTALWYIVKYTSSATFSRKPQIKYGWNYVTSNTGDIQFNNGTYGASVQMTVNMGQSKISLDAFAQTDPANWTKKIAILLTNPSGRDVINKSVTHNQFVSYDAASPYGKYSLRFVTSNKMKWDCYYTIVDFNKPKIPPNYRSAIDMGGNIINYIDDATSNKRYIIPSDSHRFQQSQFHYTINAQQLGNQFYDINQEAYVNDLKNYSVGDMVYFSDLITNISYNENEDNTTIDFGEDESVTSWKFAGNLLERYKKGDKLDLKFKVINEYESDNYVFENIDYLFDAVNNNQCPNIENYL